jgi:hypothetical protein
MLRHTGVAITGCFIAASNGAALSRELKWLPAFP